MPLLNYHGDDLEDIHHLHSYWEVDEFNTLGIPKDIEQTKEVLKPILADESSEKRKMFDWKITDIISGEFVGLAGLNLSQDKYRLGEIYCKLLPDHWKKGYATEVSMALIKTGFNVFNLHKIEAGAATNNRASIRVLEKVGMTREGLRRKILPIRGEWVDNFHFGILEDDPKDY